jgi:hypothetical protein
MYRLLVLAGLLLFLMPSCKDAGTSPDAGNLGSFNYTAFDTVGNVLMRGSLTLHNDSSRITGNWQFDDGRHGELLGTETDGMIAVNLNPRFVDNNLLLRGKLSGSTYAGDWEQYGYPGLMAKGTFSAIRK